MWQTGSDIAHTLMPKLEDLRTAVDALEAVFPARKWPFPQYSELLFTLE
jgi:glutamine synthetase type III